MTYKSSFSHSTILFYPIWHTAKNCWSCLHGKHLLRENYGKLTLHVGHIRACCSFHPHTNQGSTLWGKGANGRLGHGDTEDRICPTLVYYPGLSWMWNHGLVHVKPVPASSPHNGTVNNFEGLQTRLTTAIDVRAANGFLGRWYKWKTGNRSQE